MTELKVATTPAVSVPRQGGPPREGPASHVVGTRTDPVAVHQVVPPEQSRLLFGLRIAALTLDEVVDLCDVAIRNRTRMLVGVLNAAKVVNTNRDAFLRDSLLECDVLLADGQSVVWGSRVLGRRLPERVAGIDLFESLLQLADANRHRVYLLGARQEVLDRVVAVVAERWPGAEVVGTRNGYFTDGESAEVAAQIAASGADMLFLGMTTPKKEIFLGSHAVTMGVPVMHGVGGSFDVLAGVTQRPRCAGSDGAWSGPTAWCRSRAGSGAAIR